MNDMVDFDDPAFVGRVQVWADERRREDRAPEQLVRSVLDGVARTPRRRLAVGPLVPPRAMAAVGALAALIVVSVTVGIFLARSLDGQVGRQTIAPAPPSGATAVPTTGPSPRPSASPSPAPTALTRLPDLALGANAIEAADGAVWIATRAGTLQELDPEDGTVRRSVQLPRVPADLLVTGDSVWAASADGPLMRVDRNTLELREIADAMGTVLADGGDRVWLGSDAQAQRVDAAPGEVTLRVTVPSRGTRAGIAVDATGVWVATLTEIVRLDPATGAVTARIPGDATGLVALDGAVYAKRGTELLAIDAATATVQAFLPGFPTGHPIRAAGRLLWTAGAPGAGVGGVVALDTAAGRILARGDVPMAVLDLAVTGDAVWVISDESETIVRFATP